MANSEQVLRRLNHVAFFAGLYLASYAAWWAGTTIVLVAVIVHTSLREKGEESTSTPSGFEDWTWDWVFEEGHLTGARWRGSIPSDTIVHLVFRGVISAEMSTGLRHVPLFVYPDGSEKFVGREELAVMVQEWDGGHIRYVEAFPESYVEGDS